MGLVIEEAVGEGDFTDIDTEHDRLPSPRPLAWHRPSDAVGSLDRRWGWLLRRLSQAVHGWRQGWRGGRSTPDRRVTLVKLGVWTYGRRRRGSDRNQVRVAHMPTPPTPLPTIRRGETNNNGSDLP